MFLGLKSFKAFPDYWLDTTEYTYNSSLLISLRYYPAHLSPRSYNLPVKHSTLRSDVQQRFYDSDEELSSEFCNGHTTSGKTADFNNY